MANPSDITRQRVSDLLTYRNKKKKTIPDITDLISGTSIISELEDLNIEDLLGRDTVQPDPKLMSKNISNKTVLITGAGGSIGSELCRQIIHWKPSSLILLDVSEFGIYTILNEIEEQAKNQCISVKPLIGSVQDVQFIKRVLNNFSVDTIYHAAAYKHVPLMELNVMQCVKNNVFGTRNLAEEAVKAQVQNFILVSTDKAVNPTNFMGASKRLAEMICQTLTKEQSNTCFSIVRFGNVLGSSGSVVPLFKKQIESGGPVTVTHKDVTRYFMSIPEAAQLVVQAGAISKGGEVFILDRGEPINLLSLAKKMIALLGLKPVQSGNLKYESDQIQIKVIGLRPGEKLFEELSYSDHLQKTCHSRIMTTLEAEIEENKLKNILQELCNSIDTGDHKKLFESISSISNQISDLEDSNDLFIANTHRHDERA